MKILSKDDMPIQALATMATFHELYHSRGWTMISTYRDVVNDPEIAEHAEILLMLNEFDVPIAAMYQNSEHEYWGTSIQAFVSVDNRGKGLAKVLYTEMCKRLSAKGFEGELYYGRGIDGSLVFWSKMADLHEEDPSKYFKLSWAM